MTKISKLHIRIISSFCKIHHKSWKLPKILTLTTPSNLRKLNVSGHSAATLSLKHSKIKLVSDYQTYPGGNPADYNFFDWTEIPFSDFEINFVTDSAENFNGFKVSWKCSENINVPALVFVSFSLIYSLFLAVKYWRNFILKNNCIWNSYYE